MILRTKCRRDCGNRACIAFNPRKINNWVFAINYVLFRWHRLEKRQCRRAG